MPRPFTRGTPCMQVPLLGRARDPSPPVLSESQSLKEFQSGTSTGYDPLFVHSRGDDFSPFADEPKAASGGLTLPKEACTLNDLDNICDRLIRHIDASAKRHELVMRELLQQHSCPVAKQKSSDQVEGVSNLAERSDVSDMRRHGREGDCNLVECSDISHVRRHADDELAEGTWAQPIDHGDYLIQCRNEELLRKQIDKTLAGDSMKAEPKTGFSELITRPSFEITTAVIIMLNTIWLGIDTDINHAAVLSDAPVVCQVVANIFCAYFVGEIAVRFLALDSWRKAKDDGWLLFDTAIVVLTVWETWVQVYIYLLMGRDDSYAGSHGASLFRVFRLARLTKLSRVGTLGRIVPELVVMARAMVQVLRSVCSIAIFLGLAIYVYAIVFTQLLRHTEEGAGSFGAVGQSLQALLITVLCGPDADTFKKMWAAGCFTYLVYLSFIFVTSLTLMNTLIAVICAVIGTSSDAAVEERAVCDLRTQVASMMTRLDTDHSGLLDQDEFKMLLQDQAMLKKFEELDIDTVAFVDFTRLIFPTTGLSQDDLVRLVLQFRSSKTATVRDLVEMRKYIAVKLSHV